MNRWSWGGWNGATCDEQHRCTWVSKAERSRGSNWKGSIWKLTRCIQDDHCIICLLQITEKSYYVTHYCGTVDVNWLAMATPNLAEYIKLRGPLDEANACSTCPIPMETTSSLTDSSATKPEWHKMLNWQLPHKEALHYPSDHFRKQIEETKEKRECLL